MCTYRDYVCDDDFGKYFSVDRCLKGVHIFFTCSLFEFPM